MNAKPYHKLSDTVWEIPITFKKGMRVPARIIATDPENGGVISPGMIGFDINCGMRLLTTTLSVNEVRPRIEKLVDRLFERIPAGVGSTGVLRPTKKEFKDVITQGALWAVKQGFGRPEDLNQIEEGGKIAFANPDKISKRAIERGLAQIGTLGSGNHYLEIQVVETIFDSLTASRFGINSRGQIVVMFHCGSRGFGHQVATDYLQTFERKMEKYGITVPDRQLACAPFSSFDGQSYYEAMAGACNLAFANRQVITHRVREVFGGDLPVVYDVAHNIAKVEEFEGKNLVVHRKGATRSFPDQPVILGGSMQTGSYLLMGTQKAMQDSFGSTAHGSGRTMSRASAKKKVFGQDLQKQMKEQGIYVRSVSFAGLAEEAGFAYKNIHEVVEALRLSGISLPIVSFTPIGNIKG